MDNSSQTSLDFKDEIKKDWEVDLLSLNGSDSGAATPSHPSSLSLKVTLISALEQLTSAFHQVRLSAPDDRESQRQEQLLLEFKREVLSEAYCSSASPSLCNASAPTPICTKCVQAEEEKANTESIEASRVASLEAAREVTLRSFNETLDKALAQKDETLRILQHDHEETIRRLMQSHEETIRHMTHEREESNRRMVSDIASLVKQERA